MKHIFPAIAILIAFTSISFSQSDSSRSVTITIEYKDNSKESYTSKSFTDATNFPIRVSGKIYICSAELNDKGNNLFLDIRDPSIIIPGGGASSGYAYPIFNGNYLVPTGDVVIYKSPEVSFHLSYTNKSE